MSENEFLCRPLSSEDWMLYRAIRLTAHQDSGDVESLAMEESYPDDYWMRQVTDPQNKKFILLHSQNSIGITTISFPEGLAPSKCEFTGSYILKAYRGLNLGDLLHQARKEYLRAIGGPRKILTKIWPENVQSLAVVVRNGFVQEKAAGEDDPDHDVYVCDL